MCPLRGRVGNTGPGATKRVGKDQKMYSTARNVRKEADGGESN